MCSKPRGLYVCSLYLFLIVCQFSQFSCSGVSDSLQPHGLQHARPPCPSPTPGVYSNSCPLSWWCHPTISYSVFPPTFNLSQCQGLSNESVLHMRWPKYWSFSFSISPSSEYPGLISFRLDWLGLLCGSRDSQESSPTPQFKSIILQCSAFFIVQLSHPYMTTGKTIDYFL